MLSFCDLGHVKLQQPFPRLLVVSEDAFAAKACFVDDEPVELLRLTCLEWTLDDAAPRLDRHRVHQLGRQFEVKADPEPPPPRASRLREPQADLDLFDDFRPNPSSRRARAAAVPGPTVAIQDEVLDAQEAGNEGGVVDLAAVPQPEEYLDVEDHGDDADAEVAAEEPSRPSSNSSSSAAGQMIVDASIFERQALPEVSLPIYDAGSWNFRCKAGDREAGRLHQIGTTTLKATCKFHRQCVCMITIPGPGTQRLAAITATLGRAPTLHDLEGDLVRWLADGLQSANGAHHDDAGRLLRSEKWHVKLRTRR